MKLIDGVDYYWKDGKMVFTETHHLNRGRCCGSGCRHCPYIPKHIKGNTNIKETNND